VCLKAPRPTERSWNSVSSEFIQTLGRSTEKAWY